MKRTQVAACMGLCLLTANLTSAALIAKFNDEQMGVSGGIVTVWTNQAGAVYQDAKSLGDSSTHPAAQTMTMPNGTTHTVVNFDGSNDHLTMGADAANYDGNAFTWMVVFKNGNTGQNGKGMLTSTYDYTSGGTVTSGNNPVWQTFANSGNNVYVATRSSSGGFKGRSSGSGTSDEWHVMTGKWNGGSIYAYLDGSYLGSSSGANANPTGHKRTRIGSGSSGTAGAFFTGQIAEVRIYDTDLDNTAREAAENELMNTYIIPEPATLGMVALLGGAMVWIRKRFMI